MSAAIDAGDFIMMSGGRDLDALVAERALGWTRFRVGPDYDGRYACEVLRDPSASYNGFVYPPRGLIHLAYHVPHWSTENDAALQLVEKFRRRRDATWELRCWPASSRLGCWDATITCDVPHEEGRGPTRWTFVSGHCETLPLAVCRAALATVEAR